ncbi:MAG: glycosyltransferase, partial [Opitutaceae bacterium]
GTDACRYGSCKGREYHEPISVQIANGFRNISTSRWLVVSRVRAPPGAVGVNMFASECGEGKAHMSTRRTAFHLSAGLLLILCGVMSTLDWGHERPLYRIVAFALLLPTGIAVMLLWPRELSRRAQIWILLLLALTARLVLLPHPADSDINRYLWEGRLIRAGESPYTHVAAAPEWEHLRDEYWPGMNQKELRTIYPPLAQWTFAAVGGVSYHRYAYKLLFTAFDVGVVALLIALLSARALPMRLAGLYAFNPIALIGFAGEGHFDPMLLFFVLLAVWLRERRCLAWSWVALGLAVQMKLVAVVLAPLFARRGGWRTAWVGVAVAALPLMPYIADVPAWLEGVRHFGADLAFNGSIHALAWMWLDDRPTAAMLCSALLAAWIVFVTLTHRDVARGVFWILGGLIVLSPTVHYWYVAWPLVFAPLFPSLAWLTLSGTMALYFLVRSSDPWGMPPWAQIMIWSVFGVVLLRDVIISLRPLLRHARREPLPPVGTLAVVVPTLNESETLRDCLDSLARLSPTPDEIIVVDGGSTDGTREIAAQFGATVVLTARGRGRQIAAGVRIALSDTVLIVHADSIVSSDVAARVLAALNANPNALAGAVGQRFCGNSIKLCVIEVMNELRALFFGISFGDQGQFFRRTAAVAGDGFPPLPLMEDVEFSLRARAAGPLLYLGGGIVSSDRRWRREKWLSRCLSVLAMTTVYRLQRRRGEQIAAALYRKYYAGTA